MNRTRMNASSSAGSSASLRPHRSERRPSSVVQPPIEQTPDPSTDDGSAPPDDPLAHLSHLLRHVEPGAHDNLAHLMQGNAPRQPHGHTAPPVQAVSRSAVNAARRFLQAQADLQAHTATLRAGLSDQELERFEAVLSRHLNEHEQATEALLVSYREAAHRDEAVFCADHHAGQFARHTLQQAGETAPGTGSVFDRKASEDTKTEKARFDKAWHQYQLEHLEDTRTRLMWNLMAGYVGQLSGTGLGAHLGRMLVLGAAAGGMAGVPAAALGAVVGLIVTPVAHTLLADPLQAMLRDVTVTSPAAELQLELFKLKARLITDSYRDRNGRPTRTDFKWLDERTGVVHLVTARVYLERMQGQLPDSFEAWANKFFEEDVPYVFGDGLVGTLRPLLRGTDPEWWTQTTPGKLTEWLGLQMFVLGPLCGAINHAVSQGFRSWRVGKIPALERRLALARTDVDRRRFQSELAWAREELKRLRYHLKESRPHETDLRRDLGQRIAALVGDGAKEEVNKPMALWQRESEWLKSYEQDLQAAIHDLHDWHEPLFSEVPHTREARDLELADLHRELRSVQRQLTEAQAKSSVSGNYRYRLDTLLQAQHRLNPSEPETPGKRWETLSTMLGKATSMLPFVAAQICAADGQGSRGNSVSSTLISAVLPPLYFVGSGGFLGWMSRTEWAGIWRQAIAHARGHTMAPATTPENVASDDHVDRTSSNDGAPTRWRPRPPDMLSGSRSTDGDTEDVIKSDATQDDVVIDLTDLLRVQ